MASGEIDFLRRLPTRTVTIVELCPNGYPTSAPVPGSKARAVGRVCLLPALQNVECGMKQLVILATILAALTVRAQQAPVNSPLLDHLAGKWLLQGTVGKQPVTHDFDAEWVLQHHNLRFHEVSREKNEKGESQYEATVFIGWNEKTKQYACVWLDVYGGATPESIGLATPKENELAFVFTDEHGETSFTNTFIYDPKTNTWENRLDNVVKGEPKPFARFKLAKQLSATLDGT